MYLWDSNILRHFAENHPTLLANIRRTSQTQIALPSIVVAEVLRGRSEYALKATPAQAPQAHQLLIETIELLRRFRVVPFDQQCAKVMVEIQQRSKTKKRYADVLIAATAIAKQMLVVTRNEKDFVDLLPAHTDIAAIWTMIKSALSTEQNWRCLLQMLALWTIFTLKANNGTSPVLQPA